MSSDYYGAIAGDLVDQGARTEAAWLTWLNEWARHEPGPTMHDDLRAAFVAGVAAERVRLSSDINLAAARLRDMATALDSQPWPGREHLAGSSFRAVCWCQIAHTAAEANALNAGDHR